MADFKERIDELAQLMEEFQLEEARLESDGTVIAFRRRSVQRLTGVVESEVDLGSTEWADEPESEPVVEQNRGIPLSSPMTGIFYASPSPNSAPFVQEGDTVTAGQIVGLIEAMKVYNEIPCPHSGTVLTVVAESGQVVQLGDPLLWVG